MVNSQDFAQRLQKILTHYGLSATSFSEKIAVNRSTISHILSGRNKPSLDFVLKVLSAYPDIELYWLLNGKGSFPIKNDIIEKTEPKYEEHLEKSIPKDALTSNDIERIVIFFKDGTFKTYIAS